MDASTTNLRILTSGAELAGTLWRPPVKTLPGAVLMVHGSGPADRHNDVLFPPIRRTFLEHRIAVLSYDKRGVGESSGDWQTATLLDLANDALAAVSVMRTELGFADASIGIFGHSQGGWIAPLAASRSGAIDWVITNSGPGVAPWRQVLFELEHSPKPWTQLPLDERTLELEWQWFLGYEPAPVLAQVRCPMLAVFGGRDRLVPVAESVAVFEQARIASGNPDVTIKVFEEGDHRIQVGTAFAPGYLDLLAAWADSAVTRAGHRRSARRPLQA